MSAAPKFTPGSVTARFDHRRFGRTVVMANDNQGNRYHYWIGNGELLTAYGDGPLYKNPPEDITRLDAGYFRTQKLRVDAKFGAAFIAQMIAEATANNVLGKAHAEAQKKIEAEEAETRERIRAAKLYDAAPELYEALAFLVSVPSRLSGEQLAVARAALAKVAL